MDLERIRRNQNSQFYIASMRPVFNRKGLFTDTSAEYVSPMEPKAGEKVTIRFRTAKNNVDHVFLICKQLSHPMRKVESDECFDFYACEIVLGEEKLHYHFVVETGRISVVLRPSKRLPSSKIARRIASFSTSW